MSILQSYHIVVKSSKISKNVEKHHGKVIIGKQNRRDIIHGEVFYKF